MCGIVGYVGPRKARPLLLAGLEKLEYRGYDSAGISILHGHGRIDAVRAVGNLSALRGRPRRPREPDRSARVRAPHGPRRSPCVPHGGRRSPTPGSGTPAGPPTGGSPRRTPIPHFDTADRVHIVVNGIVENYIALKARAD